MKSSQFHIICAILWVIVINIAHSEDAGFWAFIMAWFHAASGLIYGLRGK